LWDIGNLAVVIHGALPVRFAIHPDWSIRITDRVPVIGNSASDLRLGKRIWTPGVLLPALGAFCAQAGIIKFGVKEWGTSDTEVGAVPMSIARLTSECPTDGAEV
jgi:hypothetical protein